MTRCPKCAFETAEESCPRCGVVFRKLAAPRPPRVPPPPPPPAPSASLLHRLVLAVLVLAGAAVAYRLSTPTPPPEGDIGPAPRGLVEPLPAPAASEPGPVEPEPSPADAPGAPAPPTEVVTRTETVRIALPPLDPRTMTEETIREATELAHEHPEVGELQDYVAQAYLALALRRLAEGRYRDALPAADRARQWGVAEERVLPVEARAHLELRHLDRAAALAERALGFGADPAMYDVLAKVHYLREELDRAIELWRRSLELREDPAVRASLERALREAEAASDLNRQRLAHFIVRYEGETMEETGRMVLGSLERSYATLKTMLGFEPADPVVVILYTRRDYAELGGPAWSAGLFDGKVRVPVRGLVRLDGHVESTLLHELTHAFIYAQTGTNCPRWLQEGMAEYCEGSRTDRFGKLLAEKIEADGDFSYCIVGARCDVRYFYPAATSLVEYLIDNRGMGGMRDLFRLLGEGKSIDEALERVAGRDELGLVREWQHFVRRRYL